MLKASMALTLTQPGCPTAIEGCEQGDASQHLLGQTQDGLHALPSPCRSSFLLL